MVTQSGAFLKHSAKLEERRILLNACHGSETHSVTKTYRYVQEQKAYYFLS